MDYTEIRATAAAMVAEFGGTITLTQLPTDVGDAAKPWRGPAAPGTPGAAVTVSAVALSPVDVSGGSHLGLEVFQLSDLLRNATVVYLCTPPAGGEDMTVFTGLTDVGGNHYRVTSVQRLDPDGSGTIIYYVGAAK